jgi:hypothetical protein
MKEPKKVLKISAIGLGQWLIYCVGPDLKDDGGKLDRNEDIGWGPVAVDLR